MELVLILAIVLAAVIALIVHWKRTLKRQDSPCAACHTCPLSESERSHCAEIDMPSSSSRSEPVK